MSNTQEDRVRRGAASYQQWRDEFFADPENRRIYEEEAAKKELWLQLVEARMSAGLTRQNRLTLSRSISSSIAWFREATFKQTPLNHRLKSAHPECSRY